MTQNTRRKNYSWWKWIFMALGLLAVIVGVPIGINECYKANTGYITKWGAADVLSYYGTIISTAIGAMIAVLTMAFTISFNRQQIQRDTYLRNEKEKWGKIDSTIGTALDLINPQRFWEVSIKNPEKDNSLRYNMAIASIRKYQMDCRIAPDQLNTCLSSVDYPKVKSLLDEIAKASEQFYGIAQKQYEAYLRLYTTEIGQRARRIMDGVKLDPESISKEDYEFVEDYLKNATFSEPEEICEEIGTHNAEMGNAYETTYRQLLSLKGQIFDTIYTEIQKNADEILRFRRKNNA